MSFLFSWMDLQTLDIRSSVNETLSSLSLAQLPQSVSLKHLLLGTSPPRFEVLDIIDLQEGRFKGLFKFQYKGEMHVTLNSSIEINALRLIEFDQFTKPHFVLADKSTVMPVDFNLRNVHIDAILTVVYNGKNITVVFNDDPIINLDIETSIDELLDEELFETMKADTLTMASEFLKQDLPEMISQTPLFDDETKKTLQDNIKEAKVHTRANLVPFSLDEDQPHISHDMDTNVYNTLSLVPEGFKDVVQRISLSQAVYQNQQIPERQTGVKRRRCIKMGKSRNSTHRSPEKTASFPSVYSTPKKTPDHETPLPTTPTPHITEHLGPPPAMSLSQSSSPTLIDSSFSGSIEEYLGSETLVFDQDTTLDMDDPYENMTHPMDIAPGYEEDQTSFKHLILETKPRPRGASSNYMKFGDFRGLKQGLNSENDFLTL